MEKAPERQRTFKHNWNDRVTAWMVVLALVCGTVAATALAMSDADSPQAAILMLLLAVTFAGGLVFVGLPLLRRRETRITLTAERCDLGRLGHVRRIQPGDVLRAAQRRRRAKTRPVLELQTVEGGVRISSSHPGYVALRDWVKAHTGFSFADTPPVLPITARPPWWQFPFIAGLLVGAPILLLWAKPATAPEPVLRALAVAGPVSALLLGLVVPLRVVFRPDGIDVRYPWRQRTVPAKRITAIETREITFQGYTTRMLAFKTSDGKTLNLPEGFTPHLIEDLADVLRKSYLDA